jgi:hypothetical protein
MALPGKITDISVLTDLYKAKFVKMASEQAIVAALEEAGPGSRAIIAGGYGNTDPGHVFNAVVNGKVEVSFFDGQINGPAGPFRVYKRLWMMRTN